MHMASHIYVQLGMYEDAASSNITAERVDALAVQRDGIFNFYTGYRIHNIHFIAYAAMFAGQYSTALRAAQQLRAHLPDELVASPVMGKYYEAFRPIDLHVYIRFGKWEEILALPVPTDSKVPPPPQTPHTPPPPPPPPASCCCFMLLLMVPLMHAVVMPLLLLFHSWRRTRLGSITTRAGSPARR